VSKTFKVRVKSLESVRFLRVDPVKRRLWRDDEVVPLTPKAFDTLLVLVSRAGQVVEKDEILNAVWPDTFVEEATLAQNGKISSRKLLRSSRRCRLRHRRSSTVMPV